MTQDDARLSEKPHVDATSLPDRTREDGEKSDGGISDGRYLVFVGGLLVLIIALLAILWVKERSRRAQAEANVQALKQHNQALQTSIQQLMLSQAMNKAVTVNRDDLSRDQSTLDGREVTVLKMSARAGERLGFLPGDVVAIDRPPATAPARQGG